ncbi:MAG: hypothetical protein JWP61_1824 [Friedmanniella sp.]|nr:hypothetical protein [Friedmanniella sp.]
MVLLGVLLLGAGAATVRWRRSEVVLPAEWRDHVGPASPFLQLRLLLWFLALAVVAGLAVGVIVVGAGGRLAMRLLAATSPEAQGQLTEADEVVGRISLDGTLGFIVFGGVPAGMLTALSYVVLHRALPRGPVGGLVLGAVLIAALGARIDPLRPNNVDFDLVGPGWLAVLVYCLLALATGVAVAALAGRLSRALPLPRRSAFFFVPIVVLFPLALTGSVWTTLLTLAGGAALFLLAQRVRRASPGAGRGLRLAMRGAVAIVFLGALPQFILAVRQITA